MLRLFILCVFLMIYRVPLATADIIRLQPNADRCAIFYALTGQDDKNCKASASNTFEISRSIIRSDKTGYFVQFLFDSDDLSNQAKDHLTKLASVLNGPLSNLCVKLVGHTDTVGRALYNKELSVRRAQSVRLFLAGPGLISAQRLLASGAGEAQPLPGIHGTDEQNRRVEVMARDIDDGSCN